MGAERSAEILRRSNDIFPGGVNSPVRAFRGVGGNPVVAARGEGARIWDEDGREYIDYVLSWGPLVLGHAHPMVLDALEAAMRNGTSFGMPTELEVDLGELIRQRMPHVEMLRFVSSGTEATMSAIRLARAFTGRVVNLKPGALTKPPRVVFDHPLKRRVMAVSDRRYGKQSATRDERARHLARPVENAHEEEGGDDRAEHPARDDFRGRMRVLHDAARADRRCERKAARRAQPMPAAA